MGKLIPQSADTLFRSQITALRSSLAPKYSFTVSLQNKGSQCPNCIWDPASQCSSNVYNGSGPQPFVGTCPVCLAVGKLFTPTTTKVDATIVFRKPGSGDEGKFTPEGQESACDAIVTVMFAKRAIIEAAGKETNCLMIDGLAYRRIGEIRDSGLLSKLTSYFYVKRES